MAGPRVLLTFAGNAVDLVKATITSIKAVEDLGDKVDRQSTRIAKSAGMMGAGVAGGAVAAGGALGVLGLAIGGLGVMAAAKTETVKKAFTDLGTHVNQQLSFMAAPFVPILEGIAKKASTTFDKITPALTSMFKTAAPYIDMLATGIMKLVENVMPGLQKGVEAAGGPIKAISEGLGVLGTALAKMFENMSGGATGGASALTTLFNVIGWLLPVVGTVIGKAAEWSDVLVPLAIAIGSVALVVKAVTAATAAWAAIQAVIKGATVVWTGVQWLLNAALTANPIGLVIVAVGALVAGIVWLATKTEFFGWLWGKIWGGITTAFRASVDFITDKFNWLVQKSQSMGEGIERAFGAVGNAIMNVFRGAFNFVADAWNNTVGRLNFTIPSWVPGIGGKNISVPKIPKFHQGGKVPGAPGTEMLAMLQAGERVSKAGTDGGDGGGRIVITSDGSKVGRAVLALIEETARDQGRKLVFA